MTMFQKLLLLLLVSLILFFAVFILSVQNNKLFNSSKKTTAFSTPMPTVTIKPSTNHLRDEIRISDIKLLVGLLNDFYSRNYYYPPSKGNCKDDWDSSQKDYLTTFLINGKLSHKLSDPSSYLSNNDCQTFFGAFYYNYFSDKSSYALIAHIEEPATLSDKSHLILPIKNDLYWFDGKTLVGKSWGWNVPLTVYLYKNGLDETPNSILNK